MTKKKVRPARNSHNKSYPAPGQEIVPVETLAAEAAVFWWVSAQEAKYRTPGLFRRIVQDRGVDVGRLHYNLVQLHLQDETITFMGVTRTGMTLWEVTDLEGVLHAESHGLPLPELLDYLEEQWFSMFEESSN